MNQATESREREVLSSRKSIKTVSPILLHKGREIHTERKTERGDEQTDELLL